MAPLRSSLWDFGIGHIIHLSYIDGILPDSKHVLSNSHKRLNNLGDFNISSGIFSNLVAFPNFTLLIAI